MQFFRLILPLLIVALPAAAHADWQYTKWGMTPAQVAASSKGAVTVGKGDPGDESAGTEIGAIGTHVSGDYRFSVNFHFKAGKLSFVSLTLLEGDPLGLKSTLMGLYRKPFTEKKSEILDMTTWQDTAKNNRVDLIIIGDSSTTLLYRPLRNASASGL